jgi:hypothetical protein
MPKTYKQLQDNVLEWIADSGDTSTMRAITKQAINQAQQQLLTREQYDFMLHPRIQTLSIVSGTRHYALPGNWQQGLWFKNPTTNEWLEEIPSKAVYEAEDGVSDEDGNIQRFMINSVQNVLTQPTASGTVVVTPSGGNESASNGVVIQGLDASGNWQEETLSSGSSWGSLTSTGSFSYIANVIKTGTTWTRTITVTRGITILVLTASEFAKQYQQLELMRTPTQNHTIEYRYYVKPISLVYDHQLPQVPESFVDILEYETLIRLVGYTRATPDEVGVWTKAEKELRDQMSQTYQHARTLGARANRIKYIERM